MDNDILGQMHLLVLEASRVFEFPQGSRDLLPEGTVHPGPWDPAECGFLGVGSTGVALCCCRFGSRRCAWRSRVVAAHVSPLGTHFSDVDPRDAASLLRIQDLWLPDTPDGHAMICPSNAGAAAPSDWAASAERALRTRHRRVSRLFRRPWDCHWDGARGGSWGKWGTCVYYFWVLDGVVE